MKIEVCNELLAHMDGIQASLGCNPVNDEFWKANEEDTAYACKSLNMTREEVLMLCLILEEGEDGLAFPAAFARELHISKIGVLRYQEALDSLVTRGYLFHQEGKLGGEYSLTEDAFECLKQGKPYNSCSTEGINSDEFYLNLREILAKRIGQGMYYPELVRQLEALMAGNPEQGLSSQVSLMELEDEEMVLLAYMCSNYYLNQATCTPTNKSFRNLFGQKRFFRVRATLRNGSNKLIRAYVMNHAMSEDDGEDMCLMDQTFLDKIVPLNMKPNSNSNTKKAHFHGIPGSEEDEENSKQSMLQLIKHEDILAKQLFYSPDVEKQMNTLASILSGDNLIKVRQRMRDKGMVEGICAILYGLPGTGKTAGVMELARQSGRDILMVDMSAIRGRFVGESEKNTKRIWTEYEEWCKSEDMEKMPILLLNEADALITRRSPGMGAASDKAENAMANICLQAMEEFRGICIATSNLADNMDPAFERRWLMKVRFDKPTPEQCQQVWKSLMPQLAEGQVCALTRDYDFSPGEISNIARKEQINDILQGDDRDVYSSVLENCKTERLEQAKQRARVGF